jgi:glycosyltransferase involved in cell wall biosynthesis
MPQALAAADAGISLIRPSYSKIASSPTKIAEYLAMGLPVALNRRIGDSDELLANPALFADAGALSEQDLDRAAGALIELGRAKPRKEARTLAVQRFDLEQVGVERYENLYRALLNSRSAGEARSNLV